MQKLRGIDTLSEINQICKAWNGHGFLSGCNIATRKYEKYRKSTRSPARLEGQEQKETGLIRTGKAGRGGTGCHQK